jgi:cbb3-type cytochrome oxidase subunit 3
MTATLFSLVAVTLGFIALIAWVYWPSRRSKLESLGQIPFDAEPSDTEKSDE